jgi:putative MATE family efflux protein
MAILCKFERSANFKLPANSKTPLRATARPSVAVYNANQRVSTPLCKPTLPLRSISRRPLISHRTAAATADFGATPSSTTSALPIWARLTSPYDKEIFKLAIPALFSMLLDPVMGMVDTAIVGRLGTEPLAAVGLSTVLYNFSNFIWNFLLYTTTPRIAAAVSKNDRDGVSKITAQGLWVASAIGIVMTTVLWTQCPRMFAGMGAAPAVLEHAVPYLRGRCIASPAILMFYVLAGTFRGFKDTMTPLMAGVISNIVHLGLDIALVFWLGMGVTGAALATSLSHWATLIVLGALVMKKGYLKLPDLYTPPKWSDVAPTLKNGAFLSTRSILAMSMLMWATKLIAGFGAVSLAAHEILRQIWVFSNQAFTCLDIATQSLIAFYLGRNDRPSAAAVFRRTLSLTLVAGVVIMCALLSSRSMLPGIFTRDPAVISKAAMVLPLIAAFMPLDAAASVMDGVLLGSQEAAWMSRTMIVTAACCAVGLTTGQRAGWGLLATWGVIKFLTVGRLIGNAWKIWSPTSPLGKEFASGGPVEVSGGGGGSTLGLVNGQAATNSAVNGTSTVNGKHPEKVNGVLNGSTAGEGEEGDGSIVVATTAAAAATACKE